MYLLIDNYDSFTYNLADLVAETGRDVRVYRCDQISPAEIATLKPQGLIISPGPKRPEDAVHSLSIVRAFCHTLPILGVCLGMQILAYAAGAVVTRGKRPMHGKVTAIHHRGRGLFRGAAGNLPGHALSFAGGPSGNAARRLCYRRCQR